MTEQNLSFAEILQPMTEEEFFAEYHGRKPLHISGTAEKFGDVFSWQALNDLLNMTAIWSGQSLQLVLDKEELAPARYCRQAVDRNGARVMQPDAARVLAFLRQGASLIANDVDTLTPGLAAAARAFEAALGAKAQANVYCSWAQRQAFDSHFDTHDVFAMHIVGEKVWRVYESRVETPIAHPQFKSYGQDHHDTAKGEILMEVTLRPGDLLYLPRGQYHDALASSAGTIHVSFGLTSVIGIEFLDILRDLAIEDPLWRADLPRAGQGDADPERLTAHLDRLAARLGELAGSAEARQRLDAFRRGFSYPRGGFDLPAAVEEARFRVRGSGLKVVEAKNGLVLADRKQSVPIPSGTDRLVAWVIAQDRFSSSEMAAAFPETAPEAQRRMLRDLAAMKVIEPL